MKLPFSILFNFLGRNIKAEKIASQLSMAGLECSILLNSFGETILDIDLTPNRGDCASIIGILRELSRINGLNFELPKINNTIKIRKDNYDVFLHGNYKIKYCGRALYNINQNEFKTPEYILKVLDSAGIKEDLFLINIANYITIFLGQPIHIYDLDKLKFPISLRSSNYNEEIELLNETSIKLQKISCIIADLNKPISLTGITGSRDTSVTRDTKNIFIEAAFFDPLYIKILTKKYKINTEASYRFERYVDPTIQEYSIDYLIKIILDNTRIGDSTKLEVGNLITKKLHFLEKKQIVKLDIKNIRRILGKTILYKKIKKIFNSSGYEVDKKANILNVSIPKYRNITEECELIGEFARLYGYNSLFLRRKITDSCVLKETKENRVESELNIFKRILNFLLYHGYNQVINYSFIKNSDQKYFCNNENDIIYLINPISIEMDSMRTSLIPGLLKNAEYNFNNGNRNLKLFEIGSIYKKHLNIYSEKNMISGIIIGNLYNEQWGVNSRTIDFFDIKYIVSSIINIILNKKNIEIKFERNTNLKFLHNSESANIYIGNISSGFLGKISPEISQKYQFSNENCYIFEIDLEIIKKFELFKFSNTKYQHFFRFPKIRRDISILVNKNVDTKIIVDKILVRNKNIISNAFIFDNYISDKIKNNKKSISIAIYFYNNNRTLHSDEINHAFNNVISLIKEDFKAELRS